jgi:hypothetical protein
MHQCLGGCWLQGYSSAGDMRALDSDDDHEGAGTMGGPGTAQQQPMVVSPLPARSPSPLLSPSNLDGTPFVPAPGAGVGSAAQLLNAQLQGLVGPEVLELVGAAPQHARYGALAREYADDLRLLNPPRPLFAGKGDAAAAAFLGLAGRYGRGGTACDAAGTDAPGDSSAWGLEIEGPEGHSQGQPGDDSQQGGAASSLSSPAAHTELEAALERLGYGSSSGAGAGAEGCHHLYGLDGLRLDADEVRLGSVMLVHADRGGWLRQASLPAHPAHSWVQDLVHHTWKACQSSCILHAITGHV